jgi:beta-mannosidase
MDWFLSYIMPDDAAFRQLQANPVEFPRELVERLQWEAAAVPGNVQYSAFGVPLDQLYASDRIWDVEWMSRAAWIYRATAETPDVMTDEEAVIRFNGIDYSSTIYLDRCKRVSHEGMFSSVEIPLVSGEAHEVIVVIAPFERGSEPYEHLKSRITIGNGWDFSPQIQTAGIWDDVEVCVRRKLRVVSAYVETVLANSQRADAIIHIDISEFVDYGTVTVALGGVTRAFPVVKAAHLALPLNIPSPDLWWPNGQGAAHLMPLFIDLQVTGRRTTPFSQLVGLRAINRVPCEGQGVEDIPLQLEINNRKVFIKGVNWVPLDACPASSTRERYRVFLQQFKDAGVNLIRVWGGGLREKAAFYELADELGLMVMQEFPLACQRLARTERFYRLIVQEISAIIQALRHHPCVVIWSGGNEHYHYWDQVDSGTPIMEQAKPIVRALFNVADDDPEWHAFADGYDEPSLGLIGHLCASMDGSRLYQITSAMEREGEVHGIWTWNPEIGDHRYRDYGSLYQFWNEADQHFYSEGCVSSIANRDTIRYVCGPKYYAYPRKDDAIWQLHKAFKAAWDGLDDLWLDLPSTEQLFGRLDDLDDLIFANQWMQAEGGRYLIEEMRRKMGHTSGVIWWGVNEPWPSLAGNTLLDYFGKPKLGWSLLANAFKNTILTLRYDHCVCRSTRPELWLCHDVHEPFVGTYAVTITDLSTDRTENLQGQISCASYSAHFIKTLPRIRLFADTRVHIRCQLFTGAGTDCIHQNDYIFASNEANIPFDQTMLPFMKSLYSHDAIAEEKSHDI